MPATAHVPAPKGNESPAKLAHVVLRTNRLEEMRSWYTTVLGAEAMFANDRIVFLTYDDEHHRLALIKRHNLTEPREDTVGLDHFAFSHRDLASLVAAYQRLAAKGIRPVWTINHGPTTSLYYKDPDGNRVELQVDNFKSVAELNAWFSTGAFDRNPIGVEFDMSELTARFRNGEPDAELLFPPAR